MAKWKNSMINPLALTLVSISIMFSFALTSAEITGPGWFVSTTNPVVPVGQQTSDRYQENPLPCTSVPITPDISAYAIEFTPEIVELARALFYDPLRIYEFIHNYIDYVPYYGSLKGATLTLRDRSGNDLDQASLMIALLTYSGYQAWYIYGVKAIPYSGASDQNDLKHWLGLNDSLGINETKAVITKILGSGGIPANIYDAYIDMERVWVLVDLSGYENYSGNYAFDPAFKIYEREMPNVDLASAMNYNRTDLLTAVGGIEDPLSSSIQNLNDVGLRAKLVEYSTKLIDILRDKDSEDVVFADKEMEEIIGGLTIVAEYLYEPPLLDFPYEIVEYWNWYDIPDDKIHKVRIQYREIDVNLAIQSIAGKRLALTYLTTQPSYSNAQLWLEGELLTSEITSAPNHGKETMTITVDHPYGAYNCTYADQTSPFNLIRGSTYVIISDFGGSQNGLLLKKRQNMLNSHRTSGLADSSFEVLTETLNVMGQTYMKQINLSDKLLYSLSNLLPIRNHAFGIMAQEINIIQGMKKESYYVDVKMIQGADISRDNISANEETSTKASLFLESALEHGVLEQLQDVSQGQGMSRPAASTIKLMHLATILGDKIFLANANNFSSVKSRLSNYSSDDLNYFQNLFNDPVNGIKTTLILPANGQINLEEWKGKGYIRFIRFSPGNLELSFPIGGNYYGGYGGFDLPVDIDAVNYEFTPELKWTPEISTPKTCDPVDMTSGAYLHKNQDLSLGSQEPKGLHFVRSYSSYNNRSKSSLGFGWTHSYDMFLTVHSDVRSGLGMRQPVDAAALLVSSIVTLDLMKGVQPSLKEWTTAILVNQWAMEQLLQNAVSVNLQNQSLTYIRLPDGSYNPPPGVTTKLVKENGLYRLEERFGTHLDFNSNKKISSWTDVDSNVMSFNYDSGRLHIVTDAFGRTLTLNYTGDLLTSVIDSTDRSVSYGYDINTNDMTSSTNPEGKKWDYSYDSEHRLTKVTDPLNVEMPKNTYDSLGRVQTQEQPRQGGVPAFYNFYFSDYWNVEEDPEYNYTIYYTDKKGRTVVVQDPMGNQKITLYDGQNHVYAEMDGRENITWYYFDRNHNMYAIVNALGQTKWNVYDPSNFHLTDTIDQLNHTTHYDYYPTHHPKLIRDAESHETSFTYYDKGQPWTITDGRRVETTFTYDRYGNPWTKKISSHPAITYSYDPIGRLGGLTDQYSSLTSFIYDRRNLLRTKTDPLNKVSSFDYYDDGRLYTKTDRNGNTTTYTYTPSGKKKSITYQNSYTVNFNYNILDNLKQMTDSLGTTYYTYDKSSRLTSVTDPHGFPVSYVYDAANNLTELTYPGGMKVIYTYDALNRLHTVTIDPITLNLTATYNYKTNEADLLDNVVNFDGIATYYSYDKAHRLTSQTSPIASYNFTELDGNGNRTRLVQDEPLAWNLTTDSKSYSYNERRNRLLSETHNSDWRAFSYDDEGQRVNQINPIVYYGFDYEHRLSRVSGDMFPIWRYGTLFYYDGVGNRLKVSSYGVTTYYIYDAFGNLLAEADSAKNITRYYIHGKGLLAMITAPTNQVYGYHFNPIGSTIAMTDGNKEIVNKYAYDPFGNILASQETIPQPFTFVGRFGVMDGGYMKARYYDASVGRFISEDPIGFDGGDVNLCAYVKNNPVQLIDPLGLDWVYSQSTGQLIYVDNSIEIDVAAGTGYSGHGAGLNNPDMQDIANIGPIPQGIWTIGTQQTNITNSGTVLPDSMRLTPKAGTDTFGRGGFLIHGGSFTTMNSSTGCIVLPLNIRNDIGLSGDTTLRIIR